MSTRDEAIRFLNLEIQDQTGGWVRTAAVVDALLANPDLLGSLLMDAMVARDRARGRLRFAPNPGTPRLGKIPY